MILGLYSSRYLTCSKCFRKEEIVTNQEYVVQVGLFYPSSDTAFKALLSARFCAAVWSHITDCDETYNYWEPVSIERN